MNKKPVIGISANILTVETGVLAGRKRIYVNRDYVHAIEEAGGIPLLLPVVEDIGSVHRQIDALDALLVSGGQDVDPCHYGEEHHPQLQEISKDRDRCELEAIRYAYSKKLPILGICRGLQVLNVAFGGSLYQDIPHEFPEGLNHTHQEISASHTVTLEKKSRLHAIFDQDVLQINSFHHQSIKKLATSFVVNARASDGIIEGIEKDDPLFVLGVQWHPELMVAEDALMLKLFRAFVQVAGENPCK